MTNSVTSFSIIPLVAEDLTKKHILPIKEGENPSLPLVTENSKKKRQRLQPECPDKSSPGYFQFRKKNNLHLRIC